MSQASGFLFSMNGRAEIINECEWGSDSELPLKTCKLGVVTETGELKFQSQLGLKKIKTNKNKQGKGVHSKYWRGE